MKLTHRRTIATLLLAALLSTPLLAACGSGSDGGPLKTKGDRGLAEVTVQLQNGDTIRCVRFYQHGISCDWDHPSTGNG